MTKQEKETYLVKRVSRDGILIQADDINYSNTRVEAHNQDQAFQKAAKNVDVMVGDVYSIYRDGEHVGGYIILALPIMNKERR